MSELGTNIHKQVNGYWEQVKSRNGWLHQTRQSLGECGYMEFLELVRFSFCFVVPRFFLLTRKWGRENHSGLDGYWGSEEEADFGCFIATCMSSTMSPIQYAYFYCKHGNPKKDNFLAIMGALIAQLAWQNPDISLLLYETIIKSGEAYLVSRDIATELLKIVLSGVLLLIHTLLLMV